VLSVVHLFTGDPRQGEGWVGGLIELAVPLAGVALGLRSARPSVCPPDRGEPLILAIVVGFVLVMQLLDPNETAANRTEPAVGCGLYLGALILELPLTRWRRRRPGQRQRPAQDRPSFL